MPDNPNEVRLVFVPMKDAVPWPQRVRRLLKIALRLLRLRCVRIEGLPEDEPTETTGNNPAHSPSP